MNKTRLSLFYLISYLTFGGIGFLLFPRVCLDLFMASGDYRIPMVRVVGVLLLSLSIIVFQAVRYRAEYLYPTTLLVRAIILITLVALYLSNWDPLFLVLTCIVGFGFILTGTCYLMDRSARTRARPL